MQEYEKSQQWNKDIENDPPSKPLLPKKVDYLNKKIVNKISTWLANKVAVHHFEKEIKKNNLIIDKIVGLENYIEGGAIITCNHFNPNDNYAALKALENKLGKQNLYKVIREGNYTSFKGLYGYFFRHCNTLPLSSNTETMKKFFSAIETLLKNGNKILIYPEQAMWWNYKKPRPLQNGAYKFAVKNNVPVLPIFITFIDSDKIGKDGFAIPKYTINILKPIYPKMELTKKENIENMKTENYIAWKNTYEDFYKIPLTYLQEKK